MPIAKSDGSGEMQLRMDVLLYAFFYCVGCIYFAFGGTYNRVCATGETSIWRETFKNVVVGCFFFLFLQRFRVAMRFFFVSLARVFTVICSLRKWKIILSSCYIYQVIFFFNFTKKIYQCELYHVQKSANKNYDFSNFYAPSLPISRSPWLEFKIIALEFLDF